MTRRLQGRDVGLARRDEVLHELAQRGVVHLSQRGIILRQDFGQILGFHLLADSASADYLWDCLQDAMIEFDGGPIGLAVLRGLG